MSTSSLNMLIYGAGGFGREVCALTTLGCRLGHDGPYWRVEGFVDDTPGRKGEVVHGVPILGTLEEVARERTGRETWCFVAIGDNEDRMKAAKRIAAHGWKATMIASPYCLISADAWFEEGCFVGSHVTVSPKVKIGKHVILNSRASVGHDVKIGSYGQISLGASVLGGSNVEQGALIGAHAVVMSGVTVGAWATVAVSTPAMVNVAPGDTICLPLPKVVFKRKSMPNMGSDD